MPWRLGHTPGPRAGACPRAPPRCGGSRRLRAHASTAASQRPCGGSTRRPPVLTPRRSAARPPRSGARSHEDRAVRDHRQLRERRRPLSCRASSTSRVGSCVTSCAATSESTIHDRERGGGRRSAASADPRRRPAARLPEPGRRQASSRTRRRRPAPAGRLAQRRRRGRTAPRAEGPALCPRRRVELLLEVGRLRCTAFHIPTTSWPMSSSVSAPLTASERLRQVRDAPEVVGQLRRRHHHRGPARARVVQPAAADAKDDDGRRAPLGVAHEGRVASSTRPPALPRAAPRRP